jgi:PAS domain S-box-containing protein
MKAMPYVNDAPADVVLASTHTAQPVYKKWSMACWFVLVIVLLITAAASLYMVSSVTRSDEHDFLARSDDIYTVIKDKMDDYALILQSGVALFSASDAVTRENWRSFAQSHKIEQQFPGIQGIGFVLLIPRAEMAQHIQKIRGEGFPEYNIIPTGDREMYSSTLYLEPFSDRNLRSFGYDMLSEPVRREAMEQARDTNSPVLSGPVVLLQETDKDVQVGTLMYFPVYRKGMPIDSVEHRRSAIYGWIFSPYRMSDMIQGLLGPRNVEKAHRLHLKIFDGKQPSPQGLLYGCHPEENESLLSGVRFTHQVPIDFNGRHWTLRFTQTGSGFFAAKYTLVWLTLGSGTLIAVLLFMLIRNLWSTRDKAQRIAEKLTVDLRKSEAKFRLVTENIQDVFWLSTPTMDRCIYVSPAFEKIWGLSCASLYQQPQLFFKAIYSEDQKRVSTFLQEHTKGSWEVEYRIIRSDGSIRWILDRGFPVYDDGGTIICLCGIAIDITDRKRVEETILLKTVLLEAQSETAIDGILAVDTKGHAILFNKRFGEIWNMPQSVLDTRDDKVMLELVLKQLKNPMEFRDQVAHLYEHKDEKSRDEIEFLDGRCFDRYSAPLISGDNKFHGRIWYFRDISARKHAEEEMQRFDKLQSIGILAGGIAHDFNNILQGLYGNISLAKEDLPNDHTSYLSLEEAEKSMTRAVRLTKQLLTFAKGGAPIKETFDLRPEIEETARFDLSGSNVKLIYHPASDLWQVDADKGQVHQVISNLVINAKQAMPQGGDLHITLENANIEENTAVVIRPGKYVKVSIKDEGCGIAPEVLKHIYDPYFSTKKSSSGLGLATVWSIITKHGGHISAVSEVGQGTTFSFYLPATVSALPLVTPGSTEHPLPHKPGKILVMDDEECVRVITTRILTSCGYTIATTRGGQETITRYKQALESDEPFDLVILDLTIPGELGGEEVIKDLLVLDPNVRAIVSSGYANNPIMAVPAAYGFIGTIEKPYAADALRKIVASLLQGRQV